MVRCAAAWHQRWCVGVVLVALLSVSLPALAKSSDLGKAEQLSAKVLELYNLGQFAEAIPLAQQALAITKQVSGPQHSDTVTSLNNLAALYKATGAYAEAKPLFEEALAIRKGVLGPQHSETATSLNNLAALYKAMGAYAEAKPLYEESLAITKQLLGIQHPNTVAILNNLGILYQATGAYAKAMPLYEEALAIRKRVLGLRHRDTAVSLNSLAALYEAIGAYGKAKSLYEEALAIRKQVLGPRHPDTATSLNNLAGLYDATGAYAEAKPLYEEALAITKQSLGPLHPDTAMSLNNLAALYQVMGAYTEAKPLFEEALAIRQQVLGSQHPSTATSLNNLAMLYQATGAYAKAMPLYEEALAIRKHVSGLQHPSTATSLNNLAMLDQATGDYAKAKPLYEEALAIRQQILGPQHPYVAASKSNLAMLAWDENRMEDALEHLRHAAEIEETNLRSFLVQGDETRKRSYMATLTGSTDAVESFAVTAMFQLPAAIGLGLEVLLQRKGRVLDVLAETLTRVRTSAAHEDQTRWAQYVALQTDWATLSRRGPESLPVDQYRAHLTKLELQAKMIAEDLSKQNSQFRAVLEPVTLAQVQQALPPQTVLLEWTQYVPFNPKATKQEPRWRTPRYAVYVLKPTGDPVLVDVGEAKAVDKLVMALLAAVRRPDQQQAVAGLAKELDQLLVQPLRPHLESIEQVLIAPDGQLNLLPFSVLQDASGHFLADQYELTNLTSGRDLLRPSIPAEASRPSLLVADPDFDSSLTTYTPSSKQSASTGRSSGRASRGSTYKALLGTAKEARDLKRLLQLAPSQVLTKTRATETAVKQAKSPRILHLATHGFFEPDGLDAFLAASRGAALVLLDQQRPAPKGENPLLRSGLVLAGANRGRSGKDDGLLTALEVSSLDLTGTQLAVLSACETGVGQVQNGEGVYGLRRALVLAGVRTQVVSLWKVDDTATQAFMGHYYRYVLNGMGRSAALQATQQKMRENPKQPQWTDPYYWAAFVVIGDSSPLPDERLSSATKKRK